MSDINPATLIKASGVFCALGLLACVGLVSWASRNRR